MQTPHFQAIRGARWYSRAQLPAGAPPPGLRQWLLDEASLTRRLIAASGGRFEVQVLRQYWGQALPDESRLLESGPRRMHRIREVLLLGGGQPWVYARSVLPESSLRGRCRFLRRLDARPLGALLFQEPDTRRRRVDYAALPAAVFPGVSGHGQGDAVWGRRSIFAFHGHPLLVGEFFLPVLAATPFPSR